jgi:hypothetical protein
MEVRSIEAIVRALNTADVQYLVAMFLLLRPCTLQS